MKRSLFILVVVSVLYRGSDAVSRQQMKKSLQILKKSCMGKNDVTEEQIGSIEKGVFIEDKKVMCYIACIYQMLQVVKNNKLNFEASIKSVELMYPADMKEQAKTSLQNCKEVPPKYKDLCESSFWAAKCIYEDNPSNFVFA